MPRGYAYPQHTIDEARDLRHSGLPPRRVAEHLDVPLGTVGRWLAGIAPRPAVELAARLEQERLIPVTPWDPTRATFRRIVELVAEVVEHSEEAA